MEEPAAADGRRPERPELSPAVIAVLAIGGAIGAVGRYAMAVWLPHEEGSLPWSTLGANVAGCLAIGVVMVLLTEVVRSPHRLVRPFVGAGVLGGFTTYSTFAVDIQQMIRADAAGLALAYLVGSVIGGLLAVEVGLAVTRRASGRRRPRRAAA